MTDFDYTSLDRILPAAPGSADWDDVMGRLRAHQGRRRRFLVVLAAVALVVTVGTAAAFGIRAFVLDRGFIGLPPQGAAPSTPESGELVLSYLGRPTTLVTLGFPNYYRAWVYADGRLIWDREGAHPFGGSEQTTGFLEQRLTPEGVELLRSEIISTGLFGHDLALVSGHGLHHWGAIQVRNGDRLVEVEWDTRTFLTWRENEDRARFRDATPEQASALERLSARLTDPASWLPASAWDDREIRAYVPSRVAICAQGYDPPIEPSNEPPPIEPSEIFALLPGPAKDVLRAKGRTNPDKCYEVTAEEARAIAGALDDAGLERDDPEVWQAYTIDAPEPIRKQGWKQGIVFFLTMLPHGEVICSHCG